MIVLIYETSFVCELQRKPICNGLKSYFNQSYQGFYEVIVVDSSDEGMNDVIRQLFLNVKRIHISKKTFTGLARSIFGL